jgi:hypothetical protein
MASTGKTAETGSPHQVGKVVLIHDNATAISPEGNERSLAAGSPVFAYDRIITEGSDRVSIVIGDDIQTRIDLEGKCEILIDEDIFGGTGSEEIAAAAAEVEQVREAFFVEDLNLAAEHENSADIIDFADRGGTISEFNHTTGKGAISSTTAGNVSIIFDQGDYAELDNGNSNDKLDNLLDNDDTTS